VNGRHAVADYHPRKPLNRSIGAASELFKPIRLKVATTYQGRTVPTVGILVFAARLSHFQAQVGRFAGIDRRRLVDSTAPRQALHPRFLHSLIADFLAGAPRLRPQSFSKLAPRQIPKLPSVSAQVLTARLFRPVVQPGHRSGRGQFAQKFRRRRRNVKVVFARSVRTRHFRGKTA
jgi:hypothetical protein